MNDTDIKDYSCSLGVKHFPSMLETLDFLHKIIKLPLPTFIQFFFCMKLCFHLPWINNSLGWNY